MIRLIIVLILLSPSIIFAGETLRTSGSCSQIVTKNSGSITINCSITSPRQTEIIIKLLNKIIEERLDINDVIGKLDGIQNNLETYISEQRKSDVPELVALDVKSEASGYILRVRNVGKRPATNVKVIFTDDSTPSAFASNVISGASEIPNNVEYSFSLNLLSGINMLMKLPNSEVGYKESLQESINKFNSGAMAFIPRFHIEYYHGDRKFSSPPYFLVVEKKGVAYFGKVK